MVFLLEILITLSVITQGIYSQAPIYTVFIIRDPSGTQVSGSTNTFSYPVLSSVTLACIASEFDSNDSVKIEAFRWDTTGCYTNTAYNGGVPKCFPNGQTTQTVTGNDLTAEDAGTITCAVTINGLEHVSDPLTIRISGVTLTGGILTTGADDISANNSIRNYSNVTVIDTINDSLNLLFRCVTGLGPTSSNNSETSALHFNNVLIPHGECNGPVVQPRGAAISNNVGVTDVFLCGHFTVNEEGVYTCTMRNSDMVDEIVRVGVYLPGRVAPVITATTSTTVNVIIGTPLTLSCTSEGSPPDKFTWIKDGDPITQSTRITTVTHNITDAVFRSDYMISATTASDSGTYTCIVTNPIGNDKRDINVMTATSTGVTIVSIPVGTPVEGQPNTFDYPILSNVTLTCIVPDEILLAETEVYQWDTTGCYTNTAYNGGVPKCFPNGQTTQTVTVNDLTAEDAGTITCAVTINGLEYFSDPLTIRISGVTLTGGLLTTGVDDISSSNSIRDYSNVDITAMDISSHLLFRCVTGLGPTSDNNSETSALYFENVLIPHGECNSPVVQPRGAAISDYVGVTDVFLCGHFTVKEEGVYTCTMRNSDMVDESVRVGVYLPGRATPVITEATSSNVFIVIGAPLMLYCTSEGSPPDTFTWMKDGVPITQSTSITTVTYTGTSAVFRSEYMIDSATTSDSGTYTCTVTNPIGSDSRSMTAIANARIAVSIASNPAGRSVDGHPNTFDYPILSSVTLTCMVTLSTGGHELSPGIATYRWDTTGCYTNTAYSSGRPRCFPNGQTAQTVTGNDLTAEDAGTITCTVIINGLEYFSGPLTIRISGIRLTGGVDTTGNNDITSNNVIENYSYINATGTARDVLFRYITGLGPTSDNNSETSALHFNNVLIPHGECNGPVVQPRGAAISNNVGVIDVFLCGHFTVKEEGVYTCTMRNSDMVDESVRVGVYLPGRAAPIITSSSTPTLDAVIRFPLTLYCTSEGSPPDTFTWMKDGVPITQSTITAVTHTSTSAVFRSEYFIGRVTTSDNGTYTCTVTNPIGRDRHSVTINVVPIPPLNISAVSVEETTIVLSWTTPRVTAEISYYQIDYSDQGVPLSTRSRDTTITLTNLVSGINYFISVTGITSIGENITNSISITTINTALFQILLHPIRNCAQWIKIEERQKLEEIGLEIKKAIAPKCDCIFDIDNELISCPKPQGRFEDAVIFRARIVVHVPSITSAGDIVNEINNWIKLMPTITVSLFILTVDPDCPASILDFAGSNNCIDTQQSANTGSSSGGTIAGSVIAGVIVVTAMVAVVVTIVLYRTQRRKPRLRQNNNYFEFTSNSPIIPNSMSVSQTSSDTTIYSEVKDDRTQIIPYLDYQQPKDCLPMKMRTKISDDGYAVIVKNNPDYSETHFT